MVFLFLYDQAHRFHTASVLGAGGKDIDARCVDAGVTENVGQLGDILFDPVKRAGEQVPQIVREDFLRRYACLTTEIFHLSPDVAAVERFTAFGHEQRACGDALGYGVFEQLFSQRLDDEDLSRFSFAGHHRFAVPDRFHGDKLQFADADACAANGLYDQREALVLLLLCGADQCLVFLLAEFFFFRAKGFLLKFELLDAEIIPPVKSEKRVE